MAGRIGYGVCAAAGIGYGVRASGPSSYGVHVAGLMALADPGEIIIELKLALYYL